MLSTRKAEVVPVVLQKHENADTLSVVNVYGYTVVVGTIHWEGYDRGIYITPDTMIPDIPLFASYFNEKTERYAIREDDSCVRDERGNYQRVTTMKLRGVRSMGLLIPTTEPLGKDMWDELNLYRYEVVSELDGAECEKAPDAYCPIFDVDSLYRYKELYNLEEVYIETEKLHGEQYRVMFDGTKLHVGSHRTWKREGNNLWWKALEWSPQVKEYCLSHPGDIVYAESVGGNPGFRYNVPQGERRLYIFGIQRGMKFIDAEELFLSDNDEYKNLPKVPIVGVKACSFEERIQRAEGMSLIDSSHIREGIVLLPLKERETNEIGRWILKLVSNTYLEGKGQKRKNKGE